MKYVETTDDTCNDSKRFHNFLHHHFYKCEHYKEMCPRSNQSSQFFAVARTHKFESISDIILEKPKLCPIIDQTGTLPTKPQKL